MGLLLLLLLLAIGLRSWQLTHTEVAARDSVGYIRIAWNLEREIAKQRAHQLDPAKPQGDWPRVVRTAAQHPGYPAVLMAVSRLVRIYVHSDKAAAMQWSAQLTSVVAAVLLVIPVFLLGRGLFDSRVGFLAALLFQCLPASGRLMADGLSEPLFLLFASTALLFAHLGLRLSQGNSLRSPLGGRGAGGEGEKADIAGIPHPEGDRTTVPYHESGSPWWFAGAGFCGALAYLIRPEGAFIIVATGLVLVGVQLVPRSRRPWLSFLQGGTLLMWGALTVAAPFMLVIGGLTTKNTSLHVLKNDVTAQVANSQFHGEEQEDHSPNATPAVPAAPAKATTPSDASAANASWDDHDRPPAIPRLLFPSTLLKSFFYVFWLPALIGLVALRDRFWRVPGVWVLVLVSLVLGYFLYRVSVVMGYLSDRHTVLILLCSIFWVAGGILWLGDAIASRGMHLWEHGLLGRGSVWAGILVAPLLGIALIKTLEPLHTDRLPFREAGRWLLNNTKPGDGVDDPYCWAAFYAGRVFVEHESDVPHSEPPVTYVVVEQSARLHPQTPASEVRAHGRLVKSWELHHGKDHSTLAIYEVPK
jgi:hypothetical protein